MKTDYIPLEAVEVTITVGDKTEKYAYTKDYLCKADFENIIEIVKTLDKQLKK